MREEKCRVVRAFACTTIDVLCSPPPSVRSKGVFYKLRGKERSREWVCFLVCRAFMIDSFLRFAFVSFVNHISHCASSFNFHKYMSRKSKLTPIQSTPHTKRRYRQNVVLWRHLLSTRICSLNYIREIITGLEHAQSRKHPESCIFSDAYAKAQITFFRNNLSHNQGCKIP